jgi:hypothetical protein
LFPSPYGSIFIDDTFKPIVLSSRPVEEAITPFPMPLMTPPETRTYFMMAIIKIEEYGAVLAVARREGKEEDVEDLVFRGVYNFSLARRVHRVECLPEGLNVWT